MKETEQSTPRLGARRTPGTPDELRLRISRTQRTEPAARAFTEAKRAAGLAEPSVRNYMQWLRHLDRCFGRPFEEVQGDDVIRFLAELHGPAYCRLLATLEPRLLVDQGRR